MKNFFKKSAGRNQLTVYPLTIEEKELNLFNKPLVETRRFLG
jgi:hypothetical protein